MEDGEGDEDGSAGVSCEPLAPARGEGGKVGFLEPMVVVDARIQSMMVYSINSQCRTCRSQVWMSPSRPLDSFVTEIVDT